MKRHYRVNGKKLTIDRAEQRAWVSGREMQVIATGWLCHHEHRRRLARERKRWQKAGLSPTNNSCRLVLVGGGLVVKFDSPGSYWGRTNTEDQCRQEAKVWRSLSRRSDLLRRALVPVLKSGLGWTCQPYVERGPYPGTAKADREEHRIQQALNRHFEDHWDIAIDGRNAGWDKDGNVRVWDYAL